MSRCIEGEVIGLTAVHPDGDLACDFALAKDVANIRERLSRGLIPPVHRRSDGVEVTFAVSVWGEVRAYLEMESQCCSFLDLAAERRPDSVRLTVTGRPDARDFIWNIFESVS